MLESGSQMGRIRSDKGEELRRSVGEIQLNRNCACVRHWLPRWIGECLKNNFESGIQPF